MAASSPAIAARIPREVAQDSTVSLFAPGVPLAWRYGVLRYADDSDSYKLLRLREWALKGWHGLLRMPRTSADTRRTFLDYRGAAGSYFVARAHCHTRNHFVVALPFEQEPLGEELFNNPTFIRPLVETEKDSLFQSLYTQALADYICPALSARVKELERISGEQADFIRQFRDRFGHL